MSPAYYYIQVIHKRLAVFDTNRVKYLGPAFTETPIMDSNYNIVAIVDSYDSMGEFWLGYEVGLALVESFIGLGVYDFVPHFRTLYFAPALQSYPRQLERRYYDDFPRR